MAKKKIDGKIIDTYRQNLDSSPVTYEVKLYLHKDYQWGMSFKAYCAELDLYAEDKDINVLKKKMKALVEEAASFVWEPYLEIDVTYFKHRGPDEFFGSENETAKVQLEVEVTRWEFATKNGKKYSRRWGTKYANEGQPEPHADRNTCDVGGMSNGNEITSTSIVKDTPEVREALLKLKMGLTQMTAAIGMALSQKSIEKTIKGLLAGGGLPALPAPKKGK